VATEVRTDYGGVFRISSTQDIASQNANATADNALTVPGVLLTDDVLSVVSPATLNNGLVVQSARVTAADQITVRMSNLTAGALDPASGTYIFVIGRR